MVGKWHLGSFRQPGHGFDHWVAFTKGHTTDFYDNEVYADGGGAARQGQHIVEHFSDRAIEFLRAPRPRPPVLPPGRTTTVRTSSRRPWSAPIAATRSSSGSQRRPFAPFPPLDDRMIRSVVVPFDFDLDPHEEYTLAQRVQQPLVDRAGAQRPDDPGQRRRAERARRPRRSVACSPPSTTEGLADDTIVVMTTDQGNPLRPDVGCGAIRPWTDPPFVHDVTFRVPVARASAPAGCPAQRVVDSDRVSGDGEHDPAADASGEDLRSE